MKTLALILLVPALVIGFMWAAGHFLPPPGSGGSPAVTTPGGTVQTAVVPCSQLPASMRARYC